jgi:ABC-type glycerol-3-phosphate transport system permease component
MMKEKLLTDEKHKSIGTLRSSGDALKQKISDLSMMRQYTEQSVPPDLLEAARVDGCNEFRIYWQIVLPLLRPGLGALGVWTFINSYNSFLWPLIAIGNPDRFTLPLGLQALFGAQSHQFNLVMAGSVLASVPAIAIFLALRRQLIEGLSAGSVKG